MSQDSIIHSIQASKKYRDLYTPLIKRIVAECINRYPEKRAEKEARNLLHQIWGAYWRKRPDFKKLYHSCSEVLKKDPSSALKTCMSYQSSTKERLPFLESFYSGILSSVSDISTIADYACGLNPLSYLWIPQVQKLQLKAYDIDIAEVEFLNTLLTDLGLNFQAIPSDLFNQQFEYADIIFLLKTLPCLEQQQKGSSLLILQKIPCRYMVVSFPVKSIGGKNKGMDRFYAQNFEELLKQTDWDNKKMEFETELVYLIRKS